MAKLIHAASLAAFKNKYTDYASSSSPVYTSIAFSDDGYLYTHGKVYQMVVEGTSNPWGLSVSYANGNLSVTVAGTTKSTTLPVYSLTGDSYITPTNNNGVWTIAHNTLYTTAPSAGATGTSTIQIPVITTDLAGHITALTSSTAHVDYVLKSAASDNSTYNILFGTSGTSAVSYDTTMTYNPSTHALNVKSLYINGTSSDSIYAPLSHTTINATATVLGHVKLSDSITGATTDSVAVNGLAATPTAVKNALDAAKTYANSILSSTDAMVFAGTLTGAGLFVSHNSTLLPSVVDGTTKLSDLTTYSAGWTFKFTSAGTITGIGTVEDGDMVIAIKDVASSTYSAADWTVIQANLTGTLTSTDVLNGVLYATGSRAISSISGTSGYILLSGGSGNAPTWASPSTLYRPLTIGGTTVNHGSLSITGGNYITVGYDDTTGAVTLSSQDTWRPVKAYSTGTTNSEVLSSSISSSVLSFGTDFIWSDSNLQIGWAEIDASGNVTYTV